MIEVALPTSHVMFISVRFWIKLTHFYTFVVSIFNSNDIAYYPYLPLSNDIIFRHF